MRLEAYADGSGTVGTKPAGFGVVLLVDGARVAEASRALPVGTNNIAEVAAIGCALRLAAEVAGGTDGHLTIYSDSRFALGATAPDSKWRIRATETLTRLVDQVRLESRRWTRLELVHVPGHQGVIGNERADWLAGRARKSVPA